MIELILSFFGGIQGAIIAAIGLLGGLFGLFWRGRAKHEKELRQDYERANKIYEIKEKVHEQDRELEATTDKKIEEIREKVDNAESPEEAAKTISGELNSYFGDGK